MHNINKYYISSTIKWGTRVR